MSPTKFSSLLARFLQFALVLGLSLTTASGQAQTPSTPQAPILRLRAVGGLAGLHQYTRNEEPFWSRELARLSNGKYSAEIVPFFRQSDFVALVQGVIEDTGVSPYGLKLESAESLMQENIDDTIVKMTALKTLGVRFSIDDFGTGQSSLSYLTHLPLDQLKIDQSFVRNIGIKPSDGVIVQTIIGMASNLGLEVIAEGIETVEQKAFLTAHGCTLYQGYLCGRPTPVADFETLLKIVFPHA